MSSNIDSYTAEDAVPELRDALRLVLPLAKGYASAGQSDQARRTCDSWIATAEDVLARVNANGL